MNIIKAENAKPLSAFQRVRLDKFKLSFFQFPWIIIGDKDNNI